MGSRFPRRVPSEPRWKPLAGEAENARSRRARHAFEVMRGVLITAERMLGRGLIQAVEEVCVEDLVCPAGRLGDLRTALGMVAAYYGYGGGRHSIAVSPRRGHWKDRHIALSQPERTPLTHEHVLPAVVQLNEAVCSFARIRACIVE